jgi:hypothetical protein
MKPTLLRFATLLLGMLLAATARADNLDSALIKHGDKVMKSCRERGYKNVGVLKFRVKVGKEEPSLTVEPLCSNLAERLENLLVLLNNPKASLGILRAPGEVASARDTRSTYRTAEGRKQLLKHTYALAWGKERVKADAFLTGLVEVQADLSKALVTLEVFDRDKGLEKLLSFPVVVDRCILADLGLHFALDARDLKGATPDKLNQRALVRAVAKLREFGTSSHLPRPGLVELSLVVDGKVQEVRPSERRAGEGRIRAPRSGERLVVKLKNTSKQRVGVVLKVGGRSTWKEEIDEGYRCRRWLLAPGKEASFVGYYYEKRGKDLLRFKAPDWSARSELAPAGQDLIELAVFVSGEKEDNVPIYSLRGLSPRERREVHGKSLAFLEDRLGDRTGLRMMRSKATELKIAPPGPLDLEEERLPRATFVDYRRVRMERPVSSAPP